MDNEYSKLNIVLLLKQLGSSQYNSESLRVETVMDLKGNKKIEKAVNKYPDAVKVQSVFPKRRQDVFTEYGWGYKDCYFTFENNEARFTGKRYEKSNAPYKLLANFLKSSYELDISTLHYSKPKPPAEDYVIIDNVDFRNDLKEAGIDCSISYDDRFFRCHGQASRDFYTLKFGRFKRIPDIVVWPTSHEDVVLIVELANKYNIVLIPVGGASNVTLGISCPEYENRTIVCLDTTQMNRLLWVDKQSMLACFESGITGGDLERVLAERQLTLGHEPDSIEFSTLGGWVATRSSGMKQQTYGNIEDMVVRMKLVTSIGVMEKNTLAPRVSIGPDFNHLVLGSEGTLGVITDIVVKVFPLPPVRQLGSIVLPNFNAGVETLYQVSKCKNKPSSLRLMDNHHFQMGQGLKQNPTIFGELVDKAKILGLVYFIGYDLQEIALITYLIEGTKKEVNQIENTLNEVARRYGGVSGGEKYGKRAYLMTFTVGYMRDMLFQVGYLADSIESSVTWEKCNNLYINVLKFWNQELECRQIKHSISIRLSQIYHEGACMYMYYGIGSTPDGNQLQIFEELAQMLKDVIKANGGTLSHHHGIGKKNASRYGAAVSQVGVNVFKAVKKELDPNNVFAVGNLVLDENKTNEIKPKL